MNENATQTSDVQIADRDVADAPQWEARIPRERADRDRLLACTRAYVAEQGLLPPLTFDQMRNHADAVLRRARSPSGFSDFATVLIGNALWRDTVAAVPFSRRLLLLPQCLRNRHTCPAKMDQYGLLCEECGRCPLGRFQEEAEELGYVCLIAEGTSVVTGLLQQGKVDAVIGVSCLSALEKSFPHLAAEAIPGMAVPLLTTGCNETSADLDWLAEAIRMTSDSPSWRRLVLEPLRAEVRACFSPDSLRQILHTGDTETEQIALSWLAQGGKRWRPFLVIAVARTLDHEDRADPECLIKLAVAVECFHKASLIHDDIEDSDETRYGEPTLHRRYGIPVALNVGDFLLGEGYRLIAECGAGAEQIARMLSVAAQGHRNLCLGQGQELLWMRSPRSLSVDAVLEWFGRKTSPAFEVALRLGAIAVGGNGALCEILRQYSALLGVGYQLRDDILDERLDNHADGTAFRPSIILAAATDIAGKPVTERLHVGRQNSAITATEGTDFEQALARGTATAKALLAEYRLRTFEALQPLRNVALKSLLYRLTRRILADV